MNFDTVLLRYGELGIKSKQTRKRFERQLRWNIKDALRRDFIDFTEIRRDFGRLFVETSDEDAIPILARVFGLVSVSPAFACPPKMDDIRALAMEVAHKHIKKSDTFAIRARRTGTQPFHSREIEQEIGASVVDQIGSKVDLTKPKKTLHIEVRRNRALVFTEVFSGPGGLPMGVEGKVLVAYENKNALVSALLLAKRGCKIEFVIPKKHLNGFETSVKGLENWTGPLVSHTVPILKNRTTLFKKLSTIARNQGAAAIVTSATIISEKRQQEENAAATTAVFRPLLSLSPKIIADYERKIRV